MGLKGVAQGFAKELSPQGIHVSLIIIDGAVLDPFFNKEKEYVRIIEP